MKIVVNPFAKRQTPNSKYSHFDGSWDELIELVQDHFNGSEKGVVAVDVPAEKFFSGVTKLGEDSVLKAEFAARRKGEEPYVQITAIGGAKVPASSVQIIIYSHKALADDASGDADWEIVSINASSTIRDGEAEPPTPVAMARNFLEMAGGTKREYTADEFARAIIFWSQHAMIG
jgi:hypothetical protein